MTAHKVTVSCYHCGDACEEEIAFDAHTFCCVGCRNVYEILSQHNLCDYYNLELNPGITQRNPVARNRFNYLDDEQVQRKLIDFKDEQITRVSFFIPVMHCTSCIWLMEHLYKIEPGITSSRVNFLKKTVSLTFRNEQLSVRKVVELLTTLGYEPAINLNDIEQQVKKSENRTLSYQIGVAGFCFGNIMLISFPEYFGLDEFTQHTFSRLFGYLNFILSLPVFLFSARDYFRNAFQGLRKRYISIDIPLALGILVLFVRSAWEVFSHTGIGYFDTHAGLVFFLLIGKWFQQKTFDTLSFERDYRSYFPVAVSVLKNGEETTVPVTALQIGDRMLIRNQELIPADAILLKGDAHIDFSFVTGESHPVPKVLGEVVYAGGRQVGSSLELEVSRKVSQSYLTQLWNSEHFAKSNRSKIQTFQQLVSRYFTIALLIVAFGSAGFWLFVNPGLAMNAFTAVLIIACPCALALSSPFALGTAMRILGRNKCYLKSTEVVEALAKTDAVVFDKTGTITQPGESRMTYHGTPLSAEEEQYVYALARHSVHPLSKRISAALRAEPLPVRAFQEESGKGISGEVEGVPVRLGSFSFIYNKTPDAGEQNATRVYVQLGDDVKGYFEVNQLYRQGMQEVVDSLRMGRTLYLLSGDNDKEREALTPVFGSSAQLHFNQSPVDKLGFIEELQRKDKHVLMVGDGLNDAGALKAATVGLSVTENTAHFSPASDVIMDAQVFERLPAFLRLSKDTVKVIHGSFIISLIYNIIGLAFAVQGTLSPLIAAVLMPLSSVSVIAFTTLATTLYAKKGGLK